MPARRSRSAGLPATGAGQARRAQARPARSPAAPRTSPTTSISRCGIGASGPAKGKATGIEPGYPARRYYVQRQGQGRRAAVGAGGHDGATSASSARSAPSRSRATATSGARRPHLRCGDLDRRCRRCQASSRARCSPCRTRAEGRYRAGLLRRQAGAAAGAGGHGRAGGEQAGQDRRRHGSMAGNANDMRLDLALQGFGGAARHRGRHGCRRRPHRHRPSLRSGNHRQSSGIPPAPVGAGSRLSAGRPAKLGPLQFSAKAQGSTDSRALRSFAAAGQTSLTGQASMDKSSGKPVLQRCPQRRDCRCVALLAAPRQGRRRQRRRALVAGETGSIDAAVDGCRRRFRADRFVAGTDASTI